MGPYERRPFEVIHIDSERRSNCLPTRDDTYNGGVMRAWSNRDLFSYKRLKQVLILLNFFYNKINGCLHSGQLASIRVDL